MSASADATLVSFFLHRPPGPQPFAAVPLGPLYIVAALEQAGHAVQFLDYQLTEAGNPYDPERIAEFLGTATSDVIGISSMSNMLPFLLQGIEMFRQAREDAFVVLGGSGAAGIGRRLLERYPFIDAIGVGEGERTMVDILRARAGALAWDQVEGLVWRDGTEIRENPRKPRGKRIEVWPRPAFRRLRRGAYVNTPLLTARGCPYHCVFCDIAPNWGRRVAVRDIGDVLDEVEWQMRVAGAREFSILDDVFALSKGRVEAFCREIHRRGLELNWGCMCRVDLIDAPLMDMMYSAGCRKMFLGIESGSARVRRVAGKGLAIDNVEEMIALAAERFDTRTSFILGFPFESLEEFRETILMMAVAAAHGASNQISILSPLPQAELTGDRRYHLRFDREMVSSLAYARFGQQSRLSLKRAMTESVCAMIEDDPVCFSVFYHFEEGLVREKINLARTFGMKL